MDGSVPICFPFPEPGSQRSDQPRRGVPLSRRHPAPLRQRQSDPSLSDFLAASSRKAYAATTKQGTVSTAAWVRTCASPTPSTVFSSRKLTSTKALSAKVRARRHVRSWPKAGCAWFHKASKASIIPAVFFSRRWGDLHALQDQLPLVLDDPLHDLSALKLHRAGHGGGKVDVPLLALLALDQLDLGGVAQRRTSCSVV